MGETHAMNVDQILSAIAEARASTEEREAVSALCDAAEAILRRDYPEALYHLGRASAATNVFNQAAAGWRVMAKRGVRGRIEDDKCA